MNLCLENHKVPVMPSIRRRCRPLLGTFVEIAVEQDGGAPVDAAINTAFAAIERVHRLMSFHDPESEISALNCRAADESVLVSTETYQVLEYAKELHEATQGIFDITVASALMDEGVLPQHPFLRKDYQGRNSDIALLPGNRVRFLRPLCIDLGGIAKGFAVDQAVKILEQNGIKNGLVNAGGDMRCFGDQEHSVWIRPFAGSEEVLASPVFLKNMAIATSSVRMDSIFSVNLASAAHVKMPLGEILKKAKTVTVFADQCVLADALTKVVLLGSEDVAHQCLLRYQAKAVVGSDGRRDRAMGVI